MAAGTKTRIGLGVGLAVVLAGVTGLQARPAPDLLVLDCELAVGVERVAVQGEPVAVAVRHSVALGDSIAVSLPEESKVQVAGVARGEEPQTLNLTLNTSEAVAGSYELTVGDGQTECRGTIRVGAEAEGIR